jgi:hypothetical protein
MKSNDSAEKRDTRSFMEDRMLDYDMIKRENKILKEENKLLRGEILKRTDKMEKTELVQLLDL